MQEGNFTEINGLGERLSLVIDCPVKYPGYDKNMFMCEHGIGFPLFRLKASTNWSWVVEKHNGGESGCMDKLVQA